MILMCVFEEVLGLTHEKPLRFRQNNANFCPFEYIKDSWNLIIWNDISHLENMEF